MDSVILIMVNVYVQKTVKVKSVNDAKFHLNIIQSCLFFCCWQGLLVFTILLITFAIDACKENVSVV